MGLIGPSGRDPRGICRQLQGRNDDVALANAAYHRVAEFPRVTFALPPFLGRYLPEPLTRDVDIKFGAHPQPVRHRGDLIDTSASRRPGKSLHITFN